MTIAIAAREKYAMPRVYKYLVAVEVAYGVSLKFWLDLRAAPDGDPDLLVACWGSGSAFDLIPEGIQPRPLTIYTDEEECLGEALYWSIQYVERLLNRVREPVGPRPSL